MFWFFDNLEREELDSLARAAGYVRLDVATLTVTPGERDGYLLPPLPLLAGEGSMPYSTILLVNGRAGPERDLPPAPGLPAWASPLVDTLMSNLSPYGTLFVTGLPLQLPYFGLELERRGFTFKYWYAVQWQMGGPDTPGAPEAEPPAGGLPTVHLGILHYVRNRTHFTISKVRTPHQYCRFCGEPLADWGGKKASRNPAGRVISDVWLQMATWPTRAEWQREILRRLFSLAAVPGTPALLVLVKETGGQGAAAPARAGEHEQCDMAPAGELRDASGLSQMWLDTVLQGDILEVIRCIPSGTVDLAFADPPYNLDKDYGRYNDDRHDEEYLNWCNRWLAEYARILKPGGSLFVLNLPKWAIHHAAFLDRIGGLRRQNWIVWDALSEPRGRVMPAHYSILFYTKGPRPAHFHPERARVEPRGGCFRARCVAVRRRLQPQMAEERLDDIWHDVHRIRHRRDRDAHPCQLPLRLMERIVSIASDPGDVVFDGFMGTGSTALAARKLGRRYLGIEIDPAYIEIATAKLNEIDKMEEVGPLFRRQVLPLHRHG